jgi:hypothetical protein
MFGNKTSEKPLCPLLNKPCIEKDCHWFTRIRGKHPQTEADIDMDDCSVKWLPVLLIENSKETRQAAAAVESMRNEGVNTGAHVTQALMHVAAVASQNKLLPDGS